jgi:two-component system sensor histidine kinase KdpD
MKVAEFPGERHHSTRWQLVGESLFGYWVIALLTFTGYVLHFNPALVGFLFLLVVICVAILCGFWQASIVSIAACARLDYFYYPPVLQFRVAEPQDWLALGAFETSALLVSRLSSREQLKSREAKLQRTSLKQLMEQLYELSRSTLLINFHHAPGPQLTHLIQRSDRERIFQRFCRSEETLHLTAETGIGLSTVKMAAEAHRGDAWVISNANEGTAFFLSSPQEGRGRS